MVVLIPQPQSPVSKSPAYFIQVRKDSESVSKGTLVPMIPVISSNVNSVGYDESLLMLFVRFHPSKKQPVGPIYKYYHVDKRVFLNMLRVKSKGKYLWRNVRGKYRYARIGRVGWRGPQNKSQEQRLVRASWQKGLLRRDAHGKPKRPQRPKKPKLAKSSFQKKKPKLFKSRLPKRPKRPQAKRR